MSNNSHAAGPGGPVVLLGLGAPEIRSMAIADLKPSPYNPRRIDPEAMAGLTKSIERFGNVQPIVVNRRNMTVIGGHQRLIPSCSDKSQSHSVPTR